MKEKLFQTITPQGHVVEETLYTEAEARAIASQGEMLCQAYSTPIKRGNLLLDFWVKSEKVGNGEILTRY